MIEELKSLFELKFKLSLKQENGGIRITVIHTVTNMSASKWMHNVDEKSIVDAIKFSKERLKWKLT